MRSYFDYAATQPMRACAVDAWVAASSSLNAGASYGSGRRARSVLDEARETVAELLGCEPIEVVFTASGTEASNLALQGLYRARVSGGAPARVVSTGIEHSAVLETVAALGAGAAGVSAQVDLMPVGRDGHVTDYSALDAPAAVATCMWANNETGAIQPVADMAARAASTGTPFHVDAVQVVGKLPVNFHELGVTTLAASAHKFGGPRGIGLLLARRTPAPAPVLFGGGQERGIRPGTVDVAGAAGLAAALRETVAEMETETARVCALRDRLRDGLLAAIPDAVFNTVEPALDGHLHFSFPGADVDALLMLLDAAGVEASAGSACHAGVNRPSHVLEAMGATAAEAASTLRFTIGRGTTEADVVHALAHVPDAVARARSI